jgi:gliding motility-associated-like protein
MSYFEWTKYIFILFVIGFLTNKISAQQLTAPGANYAELTAYTTFPENDRIYYFCGDMGHQNSILKAESSGAIVEFTWEKYNETTGSFDLIETNTGSTDSLENLTDGCYRVRFNELGTDYNYRAWVFNSWINVTAIVENSNCEYFELKGEANGREYIYYDLSSGQPISLSSIFIYEWYRGDEWIDAQQNTTIYNPPSVNTDYRLEVTDRSRCVVPIEVTYISIVPRASFSWTHEQEFDPMFTLPEAPLDVTFANESENADSDKFEWYLFKDISKIQAEGGEEGEPVDSIMEVFYHENPEYTYENSGRYMVKLIAAKESEEFICLDSIYLEDYIVVDTSLVIVSPVFTPNGDGVNDKLMVKTRSLESINFQILNRWGRKVHHYKKSGYLPENSEFVIWDGRIGGKRASAGVYFYVVDAVGRDDGKRRQKKGFVHLIR